MRPLVYDRSVVDQLGEKMFYATADVVTDAPHPIEVEVGGVVELPVQISLARV